MVIAAAVEEQGAATREIARQAASGTRSVSSTVSVLTELAGETHHLASNVQERGQTVSSRFKTLEERLRGCVSGLRSA